MSSSYRELDFWVVKSLVTGGSECQNYKNDQNKKEGEWRKSNYFPVIFTSPFELLPNGLFSLNVNLSDL